MNLIKAVSVANPKQTWNKCQHFNEFTAKSKKTTYFPIKYHFSPQLKVKTATSKSNYQQKQNYCVLSSYLRTFTY